MKAFIINLAVVLWYVPTLIIVCLDVLFWASVIRIVGENKITPWYITDRMDTLICDINQLKKRL